MPETQAQNTANTGANPYDLVGAPQVQVPVVPVPPVVPVVAAPVPQVPVAPAPAKKPGESFMDKLIRTIAKLMGKPDPFTGQPLVTPQAGQVPVATAPVPPVQAVPATPAPAKGGFIGSMFSSLGDLAKTAGSLAGQAVGEMKMEIPGIAPTPAKAPESPVAPIVPPPPVAQ